MIVQMPVWDENKKIVPVPILADDIFEAMKIAKEQGLNFVDNYTAICWYNGNNID